MKIPTLGLRGKLAFYLLLPSCLVFGTLLFLYNQDLHEALRQKFVEEAILASMKLQNDIPSIEAFQDPEKLQTFVEHFTSLYPQFVGVNVYGPAGPNPLILASNNQSSIGTVPDGWDVQTLLTGKPVAHEELENGMEVLEISIPLTTDKKPFGAIGLYIPLASQTTMVSHLRSRVFFIGPLGMGILLVILYLSVNKKVIRPVRTLGQYAQTIAGGNYRTKIPIEGKDEISQLGESLNQMSASIEQTTRQRAFILNSVAEGIYGLDAEGKTTFVNPAAAQMIGWEPEDLIGKPQHAILHHSKPDGTPYPREECPIYAALRDGAIHRVDQEVFWRKDGSSFPVEYTSNPIWQQEKLVGAVVTFRDITERRQAEKHMRRNEARLSGILDIANEAIISINTKQEIIIFNNGAERIFGYRESEMIGQQIEVLLPESFRHAHHSHVDQFARSSDVSRRMGSRREISGRRKSGEEFPAEASISKLRLDGETVFTVVLWDITERKKAELDLVNHQERMRRQNKAFVDLNKSHPMDNKDLKSSLMKITESAANTLEVERVSVWFYNHDRSKIRCIDLYEQSQDHHSEGFELVGTDYPSYFKAIGFNRTIVAHDAHTDPRTKEFSQSYLSPLGISSMLDSGINLSGNITGVLCCEHVGPARTWTLDEENFVGSISDMVALTIEQFERKRTEMALNQFKITLDKTLDCVFMFDPQTLKFFYVNQGAINQVGYSENELLNMTPMDIKPEFNETKFRQHIAPLLDGSIPSLAFQTIHRHKDGTDIPVGVVLQYISLQGETARFIAIVRDITEAKHTAEMLANQAIRDPLTGLYNRRAFDQRVTEELLKAGRKNQTFALFLCDLDRFKSLNDSHGHQVGDSALKAVADVLLISIRGSDLAFRWGGDEFIVLLPDTNRDGLLIVADRIRKGLAEISNSNKDLAELGISIGVALYPEHGTHPEELVQMADRALYIAKKGGENIHIGEEEYRLNDDSIHVVFQPVMDVRSHQVMGYEALSRDPQGRMSILALFKKYHAIGKLHELKCLCFRLQIRAAQEAQVKKLFINVDFKLLGSIEIPPLLSGMEIVLEISEGEVLDDVEKALTVARNWRKHGYKFAIDDFGAGFVSLPFIARLIPDHIKLDRSTILQAVSSEGFRSVLQDLLQALRKTSRDGIIAEGIETDKELGVMKSMGVYLVQGYLYGKPKKLK